MSLHPLSITVLSATLCLAACSQRPGAADQAKTAPERQGASTAAAPPARLTAEQEPYRLIGPPGPERIYPDLKRCEEAQTKYLAQLDRQNAQNQNLMATKWVAIGCLPYIVPKKLTFTEATAIARECGVSAQSIRYDENGEAFIRPPRNARFEDVDCLLAKLKPYTKRMGFVGNERTR